MMEPGLELRLRTEPTGDPLHVPGQLRDHVVRTAVLRPRSWPTAGDAFRPLGVVLAVAVLIGAVLLLRPAITGPGSTPSPSIAAPTSQPTFTDAALGAVVQRWLAGTDPQGQIPISIALIGPTGATASFTQGNLPAGNPVDATARIGELSRVYLAAATVLIDDCSRVASQFSCAKGVFPTTMRLDDRVSRWYADWPAADPTTIRHLIDGSSGLAPVATDLSDLARQIAGSPGTDWARQAVLARAIAAPRRFAPGTDRAPVDTEWLLLEEIIERATGKASSLVIPTAAWAPPFGTSFADDGPLQLMTGRGAGADPLSDLHPTVLGVVGNAGGMAASARDLASFAVLIWNAGETVNGNVASILTDSARGRVSPLGAMGLCPCDGQTRFVVGQVGRAVGWSSVMAYDFQRHTALGVVFGRERSASDLQALLQSLLALPPA